VPEAGVRADRGRLVAPLLLVGSAAASLGATISSAPDFVDLHVYVLGGSALDRPETLYSFVYADHRRTNRCPSSICPSRRWCSVR
jgi:alpha-1,2-mannosyltransferase